MAVFCTRCGTGMPNTARFCSNCGNVIQAVPLMHGRPLVRPFAGRNIAGVCIGLSQAYGWDVGVVRILTVLTFFFSGGLVAVAYVACWIGIPEEPIPMGSMGIPPAPFSPAGPPPNSPGTGGVSS